MSAYSSRLTWNSVIVRLISEIAEAPGAVVRVAIPDIEHPILAGMEPTPLENVGQRMDYRKLLTSRIGCHVREFCDCYDVWLYALPQSVLPVLVDPPQLQVSARQSAASSVVDFPREAPAAVVMASTLLGGLLGALAGGAKGAAAGALVGGGAGLAAVAVSNAASSPETALAAQAMF